MAWRAFARYLSNMSYGKCWYSESLDPLRRLFFCRKEYNLLVLLERYLGIKRFASL
jgi:hypothetical protein